MDIVTKRLNSLIERLTPESQHTLMSFAEFLAERDSLVQNQPPKVLVEPLLEDPVDNESVIAAIKRLRRSYSMLDTNALFDRVSGLMSAHVMNGRCATEVVVELEDLFNDYYKIYVKEAIKTSCNKKDD